MEFFRNIMQKPKPQHRPPGRVSVSQFQFNPTPTIVPVPEPTHLVSPLVPHSPGTASQMAVMYDRLSTIKNPVQDLFSRPRNAKTL